MNRPLEPQLREYFALVDETQGAVDVDAIVATAAPTIELLDDTLLDTDLDTHNDHRNDLEDLVLDTDRTAPPTTGSGRHWLLVAAAVAVLALVAGLIVAGSGGDDEPVPADEPDPTAPADPDSDPDGDPDAGPAPDDAAEQSVKSLRPGSADPGRYETTVLGVTASFDVPIPMTVRLHRSSEVVMSAKERSETGALELLRLAGWKTADEAGTPSADASIEPSDVDGWLAAADVNLLSDSTMEIAGRTARVVDVQVAADAPDAPTADDCRREWEPCVFWGAFPGSNASGESWISAQFPSRFYIVPIGEFEPLVIVATDLDPASGGEWFDTVEATTIASLELGPDAPALSAD